MTILWSTLTIRDINNIDISPRLRVAAVVRVAREEHHGNRRQLRPDGRQNHTADMCKTHARARAHLDRPQPPPPPPPHTQAGTL